MIHKKNAICVITYILIIVCAQFVYEARVLYARTASPGGIHTFRLLMHLFIYSSEPLEWVGLLRLDIFGNNNYLQQLLLCVSLYMQVSATCAVSTVCTQLRTVSILVPSFACAHKHNAEPEI